MSLHIVIVDDHVAIRLGIKYFIQNWMPSTIVSFAEDFDEFMTILSSRQVDIVLLDINIPGGNNIQMIKSTKSKQRRIKILIFSAYDETVYALRYLDAGADGYLQKDKGEEHITEALNTIYRGGKYLGNEVREYLLQRRFDPRRNPLEHLSSREMEVCHLLVNGMGVSEIANSLGLHTSTIATYKKKIYEKLGVRNVTGLLDTFKLHSLG